MMERSEKQISELLKQQVPPLRGELERDLWPRMLSRLQERTFPKIEWLDWVLLSLLTLLLLTIPEAIPILLYQL